MDGLTNIINKIFEQTEKECNDIISAAEKTASETIQKAKTDAQALSEDILAKAGEKVSSIGKRAASSCELEYKRALLKKKSEILDSVIDEIKSGIISMETAQYFEFITKLCVKNALCGSGKMYFSACDLSRLPEGFEKALCEKLPEGFEVKISNKAAAIDGGFVIEYPEMKVDCSVSSLIDDKLDLIRDKLSKVLFA